MHGVTKPVWDAQRLLGEVMFAPLHPIISRLSPTHFPDLLQCNTLLATQCSPITTQSGHALRFVPQAHGKLAFESQYEPRCYLSGEVQTRANNWHDLLNALVWLTFPKAKAAINARHYLALTEADNVAANSQRGAVRDTNTLLDESGVIVPYADAALADKLRDFQWHSLFWQARDRLQHGMDFYLFGHGLYEKVLNPYIGLTGQGLLVPVDPSFFNWPLAQRLPYLDQRVAEYLNAPEHCRDTRELTPVPLLGVPGWSAENSCESYYDNKAYFRDKRA